MLEIKRFAEQEKLNSVVVLSAVGCLSRGQIRGADGKDIKLFDEPCEILSVQGTVTWERVHLHIALSKRDFTVFGGHLMTGCIVNTTCELVLSEIDGWAFDNENDLKTGYSEIIFRKTVER